MSTAWNAFADPSTLNDEELFQNEPVQEAVCFIHDATTCQLHSHPRDTPICRKLHLATLYLQPWTRFMVKTLLLASLFEVPCWCARSPECIASLSEYRLTGAYNSPSHFFYWNETEYQNERDSIRYPLSGLPILPPWTTLAYELTVLSVLLAEFLAALCARGVRRFLLCSPRRAVAFGVVLTIAVVDNLVRIVSPWPAGYLAPYLRVLLLCACTPDILSELRLIINTVKKVAGILLVVATFLLFSSWLGIVLYADAAIAVDANLTFARLERHTLGSLYFTNWPETAWHLLITLTTANFPDVMMPAYDRSRFSSLYFIAFVCLGIFFLLNVVMAVVVREYSVAVALEAEEKRTFRDKCLKSAFDILDENAGPPGKLPRSLMERVFSEFVSYNLTGAHYIDSDRARWIIGALDADHDGMVSEEDFMHIATLLLVRFDHRASRILDQTVLPSLFESKLCRDVAWAVQHRTFNYVVDGMLVLNAILLIIEQSGFLFGGAGYVGYHEVAPWAIPTAMSFSILFALEMAAKLVTLGYQGYTSSASNCFDGFVTCLSLIASIHQMASHSQDDVVRFLLAIRLGRVARLLGSIPQVDFIAGTFVLILPAASRLVQTLLLAMYAITSLGMQLFGGLINFAEQKQALEQSAFGSVGYYSNNFNDVLSGMVLCFELLVVNNWHVLCSGFEAVFAVNAVVRIFFMTIYVFGALVFLNILIAVSMEAFGAASGQASVRTEFWLSPELDQTQNLSNSMITAVRRLQPVIPFHMRDGSVANDLLMQSIMAPRHDSRASCKTAGSRASYISLEAPPEQVAPESYVLVNETAWPAGIRVEHFSGEASARAAAKNLWSGWILYYEAPYMYVEVSRGGFGAAHGKIVQHVERTMQEVKDAALMEDAVQLVSKRGCFPPELKDELLELYAAFEHGSLTSVARCRFELLKAARAVSTGAVSEGGGSDGGRLGGVDGGFSGGGSNGGGSNGGGMDGGGNGGAR